MNTVFTIADPDLRELEVEEGQSGELTFTVTNSGDAFRNIGVRVSILNSVNQEDPWADERSWFVAEGPGNTLMSAGQQVTSTIRCSPPTSPGKRDVTFTLVVFDADQTDEIATVGQPCHVRVTEKKAEVPPPVVKPGMPKWVWAVVAGGALAIIIAIIIVAIGSPDPEPTATALSPRENATAAEVDDRVEEATRSETPPKPERPSHRERMGRSYSKEFEWTSGRPYARIDGEKGLQACFLARVNGEFGPGVELHTREKSAESWEFGGEAPKRGFLRGSARCLYGAEYTDEQMWCGGGKFAPRKLSRVDGSACFLTGVKGAFDGSDMVSISKSAGDWVLGGTSSDSGVCGWARCLKDVKLVGGQHSWPTTGTAPTNLGSSKDQACFMTAFSGEFDSRRT